MLVIIDYRVGNVGSIRNMLKKIGVPATISGKPEEIAGASKLILPGVGAFDNGMKNLESMGLIPVLNETVLEKKRPVLGVCLGMQLLSGRSEEGVLPGLGWIDAETIRFKFPPEERRFKIPHMGWNTLIPTRQSALLKNLDGEARFYFVHSYHVSCKDPEDSIATANHGIQFTAMVERGNIYGAQFHPEKSHKFGMQLLRNFAAL